MQNKTNKFAFFGSDRFSIVVLEELLKEGFRPALIVTTPPKPRGRGLALMSTPLKEWADREKIPVIEPDIFDEALKEQLRAQVFDMFIVASYGKLIPSAVLFIPKHETLNVHPSLLPKYRGPSPIQSQILADDSEVGVSIMLLDDQVDHGRIISSQKIEMEQWPLKASVLRDILASKGGKLLAKIMMPWMSGNIVATPQNHNEATFTKKISKKDGEIALTSDAYHNYVRFCALEDSVGTYFFVKKGDRTIRVKIRDAEYKTGVFTPVVVVPEGGKEMKFEDFMRGLR